VYTKPDGLGNRQHIQVEYYIVGQLNDVYIDTKKIITFKVSVRALLQANGQIGNPQVSGGACQTAILSSSSTGLARLVAWPAHAALVRETAGWTTTDTSAENKRNNVPVQIKIEIFSNRYNIFHQEKHRFRS